MEPRLGLVIISPPPPQWFFKVGKLWAAESLYPVKCITYFQVLIMTKRQKKDREKEGKNGDGVLGGRRSVGFCLRVAITLAANPLCITAPFPLIMILL